MTLWCCCIHISRRDYFVYAPSQWETTLQCNVVSHWLGACTDCFCVYMVYSLLSNDVSMILSNGRARYISVAWYQAGTKTSPEPTLMQFSFGWNHNHVTRVNEYKNIVIYDHKQVQYPCHRLGMQILSHIYLNFSVRSMKHMEFLTSAFFHHITLLILHCRP